MLYYIESLLSFTTQIDFAPCLSATTTTEAPTEPSIDPDADLCNFVQCSGEGFWIWICILYGPFTVFFVPIILVFL